MNAGLLISFVRWSVWKLLSKASSALEFCGGHQDECKEAC